ncbi:hypothetical protein [Actinomadura hibisca]|uniref:hypothetical protein n=1 Tax=Actinomadura hibisca TaxID=68565 RepID=UPI00082F017C|nr:hypothetical protein [Actinomadura hibisca]
MRSQRPAAGPPDSWGSAAGDPARSRTRLDPRPIRYAPVAADLAIAALVPGVVSRFHEDTEPTGEATLWVLDATGPGGSWASVDYVPGDHSYEVQQAGDRDLWDEVQAAYSRWLAWGRPDIDRFGITVTPDGERVWLDSPDNPLTP